MFLPSRHRGLVIIATIDSSLLVMMICLGSQYKPSGPRIRQSRFTSPSRQLVNLGTYLVQSSRWPQ